MGINTFLTSYPRLALCLVFLGSVFLFGCERTDRPIGETKPIKLARQGGLENQKYGAPQYEAKARIAMVPGVAHRVEVEPGTDGPLNGEALYQTHCAACHQVTGLGINAVFPPLANSSYVTGDENRLAAIMVYGLMGPIKVNGVEYNNVMAPLGHLQDKELAAIATYIRAAWGNSAAEVVPETIKASRDKWGTRGQFQIAELGADE